MIPIFREHPKKALLFLGIVLLWSGLRFSEGRAILAIAQGHPVTAAAFAQYYSQAIWDSPLRVGLIKLIGPHLPLLSLAFLLISLLVVALAFVRNVRIASAFGIALLFTPLLKVVLQNVGTGDGITATLGILLVVLEGRIGLALVTFALCLWHPQQSFFIIVSALLTRTWLGEHPLDRRKVTIVAAAAAAAMLYVIYRFGVMPPFFDRATWVASVIHNDWQKQLLFAPLAVAPLTLWGLAFLPKVELRWRIGFALWMAVCCLVALITIDQTRVITLITLPMVVGLSSRILTDSPPRRGVLIGLVAAIALLPLYSSWSGIDIFLWRDFIVDLCRWHITCVPRFMIR
jgi:hypothetical protein